MFALADITKLNESMPKDLLWWHIALMILVGGAITLWGMHRMVSTWITLGKPYKEGSDTPMIITMIGDIVGLLICGVFGYLIGKAVWLGVLGSAFAVCGGFGYKFFFEIITKILKKKGWINGEKEKPKAPPKSE